LPPKQEQKDSQDEMCSTATSVLTIVKFTKSHKIQYIFKAFNFVLNYVHSYLKMILLAEACSMHFLI